MAHYVEISDKIYSFLIDKKKEIEKKENEKISIDELVEESIMEHFKINLIELNKYDEHIMEFIPNYYVYVYLNPLKLGEFKYSDFSFNYEPVYIGIGQDIRYKSHILKSHNGELNDFLDYLKNNGIEPIVEIIRSSMSKQKAAIIENNLIFNIGKKINNKGPLLNMTGGSSFILSEENIIQSGKEFNLENNQFLQILKALNKNKNIKKAADELGTSERNLYRKIKLINIKKDKKTKSYYIEKRQ